MQSIGLVDAGAHALNDEGASLTMKYHGEMAWRERTHRIAGLLEETVADYEMSTQWEQKKRVKRVTADSAIEAGQKAWESVRDKRGAAEVEGTVCEVYERKGGPRVAHLGRSGWKDG